MVKFLNLFFFSLGLACLANAFEIKVQAPVSVEQGQFVKISFNSESSAVKTLPQINLSFQGKETPCFLNGSAWECLSAVPANAATGHQKFIILAGEKALASGKIKILKHTFPLETLTLSKDKKDLLKDSEDKDEEVKFIRAVFKTENPEKMGQGKFMKPVEGKIESLYGEKRILDGKLRPNYFHRGLDLGAPHGAPLYASQAGKVLAARPFTEEGNMVMLDHGQGVTSIYMHCSAMSVKEGETVSKGQEIGKVGDTGVASTPHVHWGIYIHGVPIDPLHWLSNSPD